MNHSATVEGRPTAVNKIRITMIDSQRAFAQAFARCAAMTPDLQVVATARDLEEGERALRIQQPHIVLIDMQGAVENVIRLRESLPVRLGESKIAILTNMLTDRLLDHALYIDVSCVLKSEPLDVILEGIRRIHAGETYYSPSLESRLIIDGPHDHLKVQSRSCLERFTPKQLAVLKAVARGEKVKDVAKQLHLSPKSVEAHKYRIMNRLGIHDRVELCLYAVREGLIQP